MITQSQVNMIKAGFILLLVGILVSPVFAGSEDTYVLVSTSPNPSFWGQPVQLQAYIGFFTGLAAPGGSVQFFDNGNPIGSPAPLIPSQNGTIASGKISTLSVGIHSISARYSGDDTFRASTSGLVSHVVKKSINGPAIIQRPPPWTREPIMSGAGFQKFVIGSTAVYYKQRMENGATVEGDFISFQLNNTTHALMNSSIHWQRNVTYEKVPIISNEKAESKVRGTAQFSKLYYISPESHYFFIKPTPRNPCWVVRSIDNGGIVVTIVDAVTGNILGYGMPPPGIPSLSPDSPVLLSSDDTSVQVATLPNPSLSGQPVRFQAYIGFFTGLKAPGGSVQFLDNGNPIGSPAPLIPSPNGSIASSINSTLSVGIHSISARYSGDGTFSPSSSGLISHVVKNSIPPPSTGYSLAGGAYYNNSGEPCGPDDAINNDFTHFSTMANRYFHSMGYSSIYAKRPTKADIQSNVSNVNTAMFYEMGHSHERSDQFQSGCSVGYTEFTYASDVASWIADYPKMPFTFIGSCSGMCNTGPGNLSDAFRKGSFEDTVTVGYCGMANGPNDTYDCSECLYDHLYDWQDSLFRHMQQGETVKDAFDNAIIEEPKCLECVRFEGDPTFKVVPTVRRGGPVDTITTVLSHTPEPSSINQKVSILAFVAQKEGSVTPTGSVQFYDGNTPLASPVLLDKYGDATINQSFYSTGSHSITARYFSNNTNFFNNSTSQPITHVVLIPSTTTVRGTPNPSVHGQQVAMQATVAGGIRIRSGPVGWAPAGEVQWVIDGVPQPTTSTLKNGQTTGQVSWLSVGNHTITASYPGDSNNAASSASYMQVVKKAGSTVSWGSSRNATVFGQPVTFTAVVSAEPPGTGIPTGNVTFFDRYMVIADKVPLDAAGKAVYPTSKLATGTHSIRLTYNGDMNFNRSSIQWTQLVQKADTTLSLESSGSPSLMDDPVTFYTTVMIVSPGSGTIGGTVRFFDGDMLLGTRSVSPAGEASYTTPKLSPGNHSITARFSGNNDLNPSGSSVVIHTVQSGLL